MFDFHGVSSLLKVMGSVWVIIDNSEFQCFDRADFRIAGGVVYSTEEAARKAFMELAAVYPELEVFPKDMYMSDTRTKFKMVKVPVE